MIAMVPIFILPGPGASDPRTKAAAVVPPAATSFSGSCVKDSLRLCGHVSETHKCLVPLARVCLCLVKLRLCRSMKKRVKLPTSTQVELK